MTTPNNQPPLLRRSRLSIEELLQSKPRRPIRSVADIEAMAVDLFESDEELDEFLRFTRAERNRDLA